MKNSKSNKFDKKILVRTHYNFDKNDSVNKESFNGISETVPNQAMTVREIKDRYIRGMSVRQYKPVWYDDKINEFEGMFDNMDALERIDLIRDLKKDIESKQKGIADRQKKIVESQKKKAAAEKSKRVEEQREKVIEDRKSDKIVESKS